MIERRDFLRTACAMAALAGLPFRLHGAAKLLGKPDLVLGLLSDTHIKLRPRTDPASATQFLRTALGYFRDRHVDGVVISGDLTNDGLESELKAVADAWFEVFPDGKLPDGSKVANLMHYGDHDVEERFYNAKLKGEFEAAGCPVPRSLSQDGLEKECWERFFHEEWSPLRHVVVRGYDFILSNYMKEGGRSAPKDLGKRIAALKLDPVKPFFYSQHRYIGGTYLADEEMWGVDNGVSRKVLPSYPNCIAFQGHTHYTLTDERGILIGDYVTINNGALAYVMSGRIRENGSDRNWVKTDYMRRKQMPQIKGGHHGAVMSVKGDLVTIEHRDFECNLPLGPDVVFLIGKGDRQRYSNAARAARSIAPEFPKGARVTVSEGFGTDRLGRKNDQVTVSFPTVKSSGSHPRAFEYFVRAERTDGTPILEKRVFPPGGDRPEEKDLPLSTCVFARHELGDAAEVCFRVSPANCWGKCGQSIEGRMS